MMACIVVTAADRLRARRDSGRGRRATRSQDRAAEEEKEKDDDEIALKGYTIEELRARSYDFVSRLLRDGPISRDEKSTIATRAAARQWWGA